MRGPVVLLIALLLVGCGGAESESRDADSEDLSDAADAAEGPSDLGVSITPDAGAPDAGTVAPDAGMIAPDAGSAADAGPPCPEGAGCNPIPIDHFPFSDQRDTRAAPSQVYDNYACASATDESGGEWVYALTITQPSRVEIQLDDVAGDSVDVDLQLLDALDAASCTARDNKQLALTLEPGLYYLVVDTWVNGAGTALAGPYQLDVNATPITVGSCATLSLDQEMYWSSCDPSLDCYEANNPSGSLARFLRTPASGPVVLEAHLVTVSEPFAGGWPTSFTDQITRHYQISEAATGYVMARNQSWAPAGEGGSEFGGGATGAPVPVLDEAWYINMYWRHRPAAGRRMIVSNPANGRAVVASAGYETGPGSNTAVAGVTEEIHDYLGTGHRDVLRVGFAVDDTLPLGPISCP